MCKEDQQNFSDDEARKRFEAALRGARAAGAKPAPSSKDVKGPKARKGKPGG